MKLQITKNIIHKIKCLFPIALLVFALYLLIVSLIFLQLQPIMLSISLLGAFSLVGVILIPQFFKRTVEVTDKELIHELGYFKTIVELSSIRKVEKIESTSKITKIVTKGLMLTYNTDTRLFVEVEEVDELFQKLNVNN